MLDLNGFLHLKGVLQGNDLAAARSAAVRYATVPVSELPAPFDKVRAENDADVYVSMPNIASHLGYAFAFDKSLERIIFHPRIWPIVMELSGGKPRLGGGTVRHARAARRDINRHYCASRCACMHVST